MSARNTLPFMIGYDLSYGYGQMAQSGHSCNLTGARSYYQLLLVHPLKAFLERKYKKGNKRD